MLSIVNPIYLIFVCGLHYINITITCRVLLVGVPVARLPVVCYFLSREFLFSLDIIR
jgi:hypothetical protein